MTGIPRLSEELDRFSISDSGCWNWQGSIGGYGYGQVFIKRHPHKAHRLVWEALNGKIPDGKQIDHLCRNRACVNPAHMEIVTCKENVLRGIGVTAVNHRKTHCVRGHLLAGDNLKIRKGWRVCCACRRQRQKVDRAKWYESGKGQAYWRDYRDRLREKP